MDYKLLTDKNVLKGTCYFEFLPGKYQKKCWNDNSVFLTEKSVFIFEDLLEESNKQYDHYSFGFYDPDKINVLENKLLVRLMEIKDGKNVNIKYSKIFNEMLKENIDKNRDMILKMLDDLISWLRSNKEQGISVLGL
jgi:hypothetical protein